MYGIRVVFDLAYHANQGPIPVSAISRRQAISVPYVEQILFLLRRQGVVKSTRGLRGGYQLARRPETVTVGEVIRIFEGPGLRQLKVPEPRTGERYHVVDQIVGELVWARLARAMDEVFDDVTFKQLCDEARKILKAQTFDHPYVVYP